MIIKLKCKCGQFEGEIDLAPKTFAPRGICMCDDCQAYAHWLKRPDILDRNGGTEILPVMPSTLKLTKGIENLKCMRLTPNGMYRWYAGCCKTPISNTMAFPKIPFTGVVHSIISLDEKDRQKYFGSATKFQAKFGVGEIPADAYRSAPLGLIMSTIMFLLRGFIRKGYAPSPYFDHDWNPRVKPYVLSPTERESLKALCGPSPLKS